MLVTEIWNLVKEKFDYFMDWITKQIIPTLTYIHEDTTAMREDMQTLLHKIDFIEQKFEIKILDGKVEELQKRVADLDSDPQVNSA